MSTTLSTTPARRTGSTPGTAARPVRRGTALLPTAVLLLGALYCLLPVVWVLVAATKSRAKLFNSFTFSPSGSLFTNIGDLSAYYDGLYWRWMLNTALYAGVGALLSAALSGLSGYTLAKFEFPGRAFLFNVLLAGVLVPGITLAIPQYLLISKVGLANTYWSVLIPSLVSPFGLFLCRIYAQATVDTALIEAARIDGAGELKIFHTIGLRVLTPALVTVFLFQLVGIWNNFLLPLIMLADDRLYPITLGLNVWRSEVDRSPEFYPLTVGGLLVSVIPLAIAMIFLQRYWRGGLTDGAVKG